MRAALAERDPAERDAPSGTPRRAAPDAPLRGRGPGPGRDHHGALRLPGDPRLQGRPVRQAPARGRLLARPAPPRRPVHGRTRRQAGAHPPRLSEMTRRNRTARALPDRTIRALPGRTIRALPDRTA